MTGLGELQEVAELLADFRPTWLAGEDYLVAKTLQSVRKEPDLRGFAAAFAAFK